jgi:hypothetical protein
MVSFIVIIRLLLALIPRQQYTVYIPIVQVPAMQGAGATYGDCERIKKSGIDWVYDWSSNPPNCGIERVAMIYGSNIPIDINTEWILGFNEPELKSQSNITPTQGAILWREIEQVYPDKKLVSPSASIAWLTQWYSDYVNLYGRPPKMDVVGSHCYGPWNVNTAVGTCKSGAENIVRWAKTRGINEVWITEFAMLPCWSGGESDSVEFMKQMIEYYKEKELITRWAWFQTSYIGNEPWSFGPYCNTSLVDFYSGELTEIGKAYK